MYSVYIYINMHSPNFYKTAEFPCIWQESKSCGGVGTIAICYVRVRPLFDNGFFIYFFFLGYFIFSVLIS